MRGIGPAFDLPGKSLTPQTPLRENIFESLKTIEHLSVEVNDSQGHGRIMQRLRFQIAPSTRRRFEAAVDSPAPISV